MESEIIVIENPSPRMKEVVRRLKERQKEAKQRIAKMLEEEGSEKEK